MVIVRLSVNGSPIRSFPHIGREYLWDSEVWTPCLLHCPRNILPIVESSKDLYRRTREADRSAGGNWRANATGCMECGLHWVRWKVMPSIVSCDANEGVARQFLATSP